MDEINKLIKEIEDKDIENSKFEYYWNGSSWWLGFICLRYVRYVINTLIISIETCKEVTSTSFNLIQEAFIRRDEDWPEEGWYL